MQPRFFKSWFGAILLALPLLAAAPRGPCRSSSLRRMRR